MTLLHCVHTDWADCCHLDPVHGGLTDFGREVVACMNELGMLIDLSHASADTMRQTIEASRAPVACTHSGAAALHDYPCNVPDDVLKMIRDTGGIVMATFVPYFVSARVMEHRAGPSGVAGPPHTESSGRCRAGERANSPPGTPTIRRLAPRSAT